MIKAESITKSFGKLQVLKDINFEIKTAEIVTIVGASGAGKTTLLQIIGTLTKADSGHIYINQVEVNKLSDTKIARFRNNNIGFIFQFHHLLPEFTALENVCIPAYIAGETRKKTELRAIEILKFLNLENRLNHKPTELSGGEQQRVAAARALINNPTVILADEPSGNLDSKNKEELHELFFTLREKFKQTFVIVTHDIKLAQKADRSLTIVDGKIAT